MSDSIVDYSLYSKKFIQSTQSHVVSAEKLLAIVCDLIHPHSAVDVGCGSGSWLYVLKTKYNCSVLGIDGDYVDIHDTYLSEFEFYSQNLEKKIELSSECPNKFDLAISLEVAEHLSPSRAEGFIDDLTTLSDVVLFSAAIPLQGGENHINEQPISYWANLFLERDFVPISCIRPMYKSSMADAELDGVDVMYANNTVLYVRHEKLLSYDIHPEDYVDDFSTIPILQRNIIIRLLSREYCLIPRTRVINILSKLFNFLFRRY